MGELRARMACLALLAVAALPACSMEKDAQDAAAAAAMTGGDPEVGRERIRAYGCGACHTIPGVGGADARVGPPLGGIASRAYIAGVLTNSPEDMMRWILDPPGVDPLTAMPKIGVTTHDARHIAAYLYTLRD